MNRFFSLLKANMSEGMNIFKISTKKKSKFNKVVLPVLLMIIIMMTICGYAEMLMTGLKTTNTEYVLLSMFVMVTSIITLLEGIYKSGNLLFNCKDDDLLLSLPIKKSTVLLLRVLKFYLFELLYNSLFLIPGIFVYAIEMKPDITFYIVSFIGILLFPVIPILLSSVFGTIITFISSKFKGKNIAQILITTSFLLLTIYFSLKLENLILNITQNAGTINSIITKFYYPANAYINLVLNFSVVKLLEFVIIHLIIFFLTIMLIGKIYFNVSSNAKVVKSKVTSKKYKIQYATPTNSLIKKELNRFISSPVFVTNAGFGLVIYIIICIFVCIKFDSVVNSVLNSSTSITIDFINGSLPVIFLAFLCFTCFMTSITSSMISLEGKMLNFIKCLPLAPKKIIRSKIYTAILIMLPFILIGDLIVFIRFRFDFICMILILIASILLPFISETMGILINLKYPRMDAKNDTEIVKQSMSSSISVLAGMVIIALTLTFLFISLMMNISNYIIMICFIIIYTLIFIMLEIILHKNCEQSFDNITI